MIVLRLLKILYPICVISLSVLGSDYDVTGTIWQTFGNTTNRFDFQVTILGNSFQLQTRDYFPSQTERIVGYDGIDFFHLDRHIDTSGQPVEFGHVHSGQVATNMFGVGDLLRLAFLDRIRHPFGDNLTNLVLFGGNQQIFGKHRGVAETTGPTSATAFPGIQFFGTRPEGPTDELVGEFRVIAWTNYQDRMIPVRFSMHSRMPESLNFQQPVRYLETLLAEVIHIGKPTTRNTMPKPSTTTVQVRDLRFTEDTGAPILYLLTNHTWVARNEPWLVSRVGDLRLRRAAANGQLKSNNTPAYFLFLVILLSPLVFLLYSSRSQRSANSPK
jgi:hypothetical protein